MFISIIIPVYNEAGTISDSLSYLLSTINEPSVEIIVVDGGSNDKTADMVSKYINRVKLVSSPQKGRGAQMHYGASIAKGDVLMFLHADTRLPAKWFDCMKSAWDGVDRQQNVTAFNLIFDKEEWPYNFIRWAANKRFTYTRIPHGDQAMAIHRDTYFQCGGFPPVPLMEEYALFKRLKNLNKVTLIKECVVASTRRYEKNGPLRSAFMNVIIVFLYKLGFSLNFLRKLYR